jgi:hypothetical protein
MCYNRLRAPNSPAPGINRKVRGKCALPKPVYPKSVLKGFAISLQCVVAVSNVGKSQLTDSAHGCGPARDPSHSSMCLIPEPQVKIHSGSSLACYAFVKLPSALDLNAFL